MKVHFVVLAVVLSFIASASHADDLDGKHEIGVSLGRSKNLSNSRTDLRSTHVAVEYGYFRSNKTQWALEADYQRTTFPVKDNTFGLMVLYRYHLTSGGKLRPFVQAGAGIIRTSLDVPEISGHLQFQQKVGGGVRYRLRRNWHLLGEVNFYHVSNADLQDRNRGFNDIHYAVGLHRSF